MRVRDLDRELVSKELSKSEELCLLSWHQEMLQLLLIPWPTPLPFSVLYPINRRSRKTQPESSTGAALTPTQDFLGELLLRTSPQPLQRVYSLQQKSRCFSSLFDRLLYPRLS